MNSLKEIHDKYLTDEIIDFDINSDDGLLMCCKLFYIFMLEKRYNQAFEMFKIFDPHFFDTPISKLQNFYFQYPDKLFHHEYLYFYDLCRPTRSKCKCAECTYFSCYHQPELTESEILELDELRSPGKFPEHTIN